MLRVRLGESENASEHFYKSLNHINCDTLVNNLSKSANNASVINVKRKRNYKIVVSNHDNNNCGSISASALVIDSTHSIFNDNRMVEDTFDSKKDQKTDLRTDRCSE